MNPEARTIQEVFKIQEDAEISIDEIANFIDSEIKDKDGLAFKVDSISIDYGEGHIKTPFFRSGQEFREYIDRLGKFWRCIK